MATSDDTFDPNDLDSIDALLDEAELDAVIDAPEDSSEAAVSVDDEPEQPAGTEVDDTDGLLDELDDVAGSASVPIPQDVPVQAQRYEPEVVAVSPPLSGRAKADVVDDTDGFVSKRAAAQSNQKSQLAAGDMDSIKKLIIIFSSTLIVLALTGIGIGVWSALAASSAGIDEETITMIESIQVNSELGANTLSTTNKSVQSVEKKLDAINFQLEQLAADLAAASVAKAEQPKHEIIDPLGLGVPGVVDKGHGPVVGGHAASTPVPPVEVRHAPALPASLAVTDPAILQKITTVNSKMIKAQRRIDEVNSRVKSIQTQYQALLQSVKTVEKQVIMEQLEKAEKAEKDKATSDSNRYQYTSPDGMFYDQSVKDSYP